MALQLILEVDDKGTVTVNKFASNAENRFKKVSEKSSSFTSKLGGAVKKLADGFGGLIKSIGSIIIKLGAAAIAAAGFMGAIGTIKGIISQYSGFETALVDMGKVTSESLESIRTKIMALPPELGSATSLVQGYYQVISAGVTEPVAAMETLKVSAMAAKAAHVEQSEVIKGLTKMMAGYEGQIGSVTEASDLLFAIEKEGQTCFQELIPVIGGVSKISHDLNVNQQEMAGSLALITQTAGSTSEAATQYRAILVALMKPTDALSDLFKRQGYESAQAAIKQLGLAGTLQMIKTESGGSAEKMAELFGRQEALIGVSALAANNFENLKDKTKAMGDAAGSTEEAFARWKGTLSAIWETFKNTVGKQAIMLGEQLAPTIKKVLEHLGAWLERNRDIINQKIEDFIKRVSDALREMNWESITKNIAEFSSKIWSAVEAMDKLIKKLGGFREFFATTGPAGMGLNLLVKFLGHGSTVAPLGEKISEMEGRLRNLAGTTESLNPGYMVNAEPASMAMSGIEDMAYGVAGTISSLNPEFSVDVSPAVSALASLESNYQSTLDRLKREYVNMMEAWQRHPSYASPAFSYYRKTASALQTYETQKSLLSGHGYGYQLGTQYVPKTGFYQLHRGEEVTPAPTAARERAGKGSNVSFRDIHINLPASANPQRPEDWRRIVREHIIPELGAARA